MELKVALQHRTEYRYERQVALGPQVIQLRPAPHCRTPISGYELHVVPTGHLLTWQFDALANHVARVLFSGKTAEFVVAVDLIADLTPINPFAFVLEPACGSFPFAYSAELQRDLAPYLVAEEAGPLLLDLLDSLPAGPLPTVSFLVGLNARVQSEVRYTTRLEHGVQTPEETLEQRSGSCRDSAWLLVEACRHLGLAARFVSGYLIQLADHENTAPGEATGRTEDSADLHAWAEVFLPGAGWIGFDATSGLLTAECHIPLACAPTPAGAAPIGGTVEPAHVDFSYSLSIRRLDGAPLDLPSAAKKTASPEPLASENPPPISAPFSEEEWARVRVVAHAVDRDLQAQDVRLTMGGEPTFVGIDEAESPQWNIEALGPHKRTLGLELIRSLRERTAPGALLHLGQGKWYPGEALPRWAFHCVSRKDGVAVWEDGDLFALEQQAYGFTGADALAFLQALTRRLQVTADNILPAFDPATGPDDEAPPVGYVLPLRRRQPGGTLAWSSQPWFPRAGKFVLFPGDSPIGYRIPVESMPFVAPDTLMYENERGPDGEPMPDRALLPPGPARRPELFGIEPEPDTLDPVPENAADAPVLVRPALCVQVREGRLHVFLPFVPVLPDYLDLVAAVEDTARFLTKPVWVEGYTAPYDPRVQTFSLTPDPGVLEVNLPPTGDWNELETLNVVLAEEAQKHRLIPGKFAYDGSHLATGGGSHITLGGPTVPDSPVLRRPDLLRSMVTFWQNHPSLSYLFAGMYVGPTSQYPRVDEARVDALYELEVAFSHIPAENCEPYILDGLFRNLLVDVTGNSHRAEFCIDKMYPPEGQGLRAGLLELRAFEMAPHVRMGLLAMLLVRALVCRFWRQPFPGNLLRWGAALHDRFMLPHFVEKDFAEVLAGLRDAGYAFEDRWFAAQREFRFPLIGSIRADGLELELRQALEPWNVLAEETSAGGTGRSVDSSLERMQVKLTGLRVGSPYVVACNGRRVPLHATDAPGESVAGIRYRARRLTAALHPTIPVHTPLTFDLIDTRKECSIARCTYYAGPPDGSVHTTRPADAGEAHARRQQRFQVGGPPAGRMPAPPEETNPVFPMTLDMRWPSPAEQASPGVPAFVSAPLRQPDQPGQPGTP